MDLEAIKPPPHPQQLYDAMPVTLEECKEHARGIAQLYFMQLRSKDEELADKSLQLLQHFRYRMEALQPSSERDYEFMSLYEIRCPMMIYPPRHQSSPPEPLIEQFASQEEIEEIYEMCGEYADKHEFQCALVEVCRDVELTFVNADEVSTLQPLVSRASDGDGRRKKRLRPVKAVPPRHKICESRCHHEDALCSMCGRDVAFGRFKRYFDQATTMSDLKRMRRRESWRIKNHDEYGDEIEPRLLVSHHARESAFIRQFHHTKFYRMTSEHERVVLSKGYYNSVGCSGYVGLDYYVVEPPPRRDDDFSLQKLAMSAYIKGWLKDLEDPGSHRSN